MTITITPPEETPAIRGTEKVEVDVVLLDGECVVLCSVVVVVVIAVVASVPGFFLNTKHLIYMVRILILTFFGKWCDAPHLDMFPQRNCPLTFDHKLNTDRFHGKDCLVGL